MEGGGRFPSGTVLKKTPANAGDARDMSLSPGWKIPLSRKWQPTPVFLPGKFHGQRSLASYSQWGRRVGYDQVIAYTH